MKQLKDYLHYYMGVTYRTDNSQGEVNPETLRFIYPMIEKGKGVQLHLRRLEDMTEDEAIEFLKHANPGAEYITHNEYAVIWQSQGSRSEIFYLFGPPAGFHCLLSKGFDLFGLIDAGLAIDAKTITHDPPLPQRTDGDRWVAVYCYHSVCEVRAGVNNPNFKKSDMSKIDKIICNKIKEIREKSGYSQQDIADFLDMDLIKVRLMEKGQEFPSATKIYYLCFILDCDPNEVFPPVKKGNKEDIKAAVKELMKKLVA